MPRMGALAPMGWPDGAGVKVWSPVPTHAPSPQSLSPCRSPASHPHAGGNSAGFSRSPEEAESSARNICCRWRGGCEVWRLQVRWHLTPPQLMPWSELRPRGRQGAPTLSSGLDPVPDAGPGQDQAKWTRVLMDVGQPRLPLWSHSLEPPPAPLPNSLWPPTIPQAWARGPQDTPVSCVDGVGGVLQPQNPGLWSCPAVPGHEHEWSRIGDPPWPGLPM